MEKDTRLINIYLSIHNKRPITLDDLRYLALYSPECFEKTCKNVIYNKPETKPIMEPSAPENTEIASPPGLSVSDEEALAVTKQNVSQILENLKRLESDEFPVTNISPDEVKDLLGNLYMELLFPHNDEDISMNMMDGEYKSVFDRRV